MDGVLLKDPANKEVGKVQDLILAPANSCVAYAVIDTNREAGGKKVALSWGRIEYLNDRENKLTAVTSVEIARFTAAPECDPKDWKRMSSTPWMSELATYYTCDPFWKTTRFAPATRATAKRP